MKVNKSDIPKNAVLYFNNTWCSQCYTENIVITSVEKQFDLPFVHVNADENPELTKTYGIFSAPSLVIIKNGEVKERLTHYLDEKQLSTFLNYYFKEKRRMVNEA